MTRRRHWLIGTAAVVLVVGAVVAWIVTRPQPDLSDEARKAVFDRVGKVTSIADLTAILGVPPGDYSKGNRNALAEQLHAIHVPTEEAAQLAMTLFVPSERSSISYQRAISARKDSHQVVAWWGRKTSLAVVRDETGEVRAVVVLPWIRSVPNGFLEKCEDWIYTRVYGNG